MESVKKKKHARIPSSSRSQVFSENTPRVSENYDQPPGPSLNSGSSSDGERTLIGTCPDMCPARERVQRERLRDLAVFERLNRDPRRTSASLAVKKFCRTISTTDVQASDIRPLPVLQNTLQYLFKLVESSEQPYVVVHDFVFDRTRSIRQDIGMQNIITDEVIIMYEKMVTFHIVSTHKLLACNKNPNISSLHYLNMEQLVKSLASLYELYKISRRSNSIHKNEPEFYSFYVLLHLGSNHHSMGESLPLWLRRLPSPIMKSKEMCFARSVLRFFWMGNYKRFFKTVIEDASYLQFCLVKPIINEVRAKALSYINQCGYKLHPYPLVHLSEVLMMKESEVEAFCNSCGLETITDEAGLKLLPTKQTSFSLPKVGFQNYSLLGSERLDRDIVII